MKEIFAVLLATIICSSGAEAARGRGKRLAPSAEKGGQQRVEYDSAKVWLAPPAAAILGFGMGHLVQERLRGYSLAYTGADALGFLLVLSSMGSCSSPSRCRDSKERVHDIGLGILIVSRIAQLVDVSLWSVNYYQDQAFQVSILPSRKGASVLAKVAF